MSEARGRLEWNQTSMLLAMIANIMRDPKKGKPAKAEDFNPYAHKMSEKKAVPIVPLSILKDVFVKDKK